VTKQHQADTEIHEDQFRNFLVNTLTGAFGISKRYTLAVRRVTHGDTASDVLAELLGVVADFDDSTRFDEAVPVRRQ
jgi:hypothetical protein